MIKLEKIKKRKGENYAETNQTIVHCFHKEVGEKKKRESNPLIQD